MPFVPVASGHQARHKRCQGQVTSKETQCPAQALHESPSQFSKLGSRQRQATLHEPPDNYSNVLGVCLSFPQMQKRRSSDSTFSSWEEMEGLPKWKNRSPKLWDSQFVINVTPVWPAAPPQPVRALKVVMEVSLEKAHWHSCPGLGPTTGTP